MKNSKLWIIPNRGAGDVFNLNGAVRYLSKKYDEIHITHSPHLRNPEIWFEGVDNLKISQTGTWDSGKVNFEKTEYYNFNETDIICLLPITVLQFPVTNPKNNNNFKSGKIDMLDIPLCYYDGLEIDEHIFWDYFWIPDTPKSEELYNVASRFGDYIFVHNKCGFLGGGANMLINLEQIQKEFNVSKDEVLFVDPESNIYEPGHKFYETAQSFMGHDIISYKKTMEHASKIFVMDSSFMCMGLNLEIETDDCYYVSRFRRAQEVGLIQHDYSYLHETYLKNKANFKNDRNIKEFKKLLGHKALGTPCPCCGQPVHALGSIDMSKVEEHNSQFN